MTRSEFTELCPKMENTTPFCTGKIIYKTFKIAEKLANDIRNRNVTPYKCICLNLRINDI